MTTQELHSLLLEKFSNSVLPWEEVTAGDSQIDLLPAAFHQLCEYLASDQQLSFDFLRLVTAVDTGSEFQAIYHLYSYTIGHSTVLRVRLDRQKPVVDSVADIWATADWLEREAFDMMGIKFTGHPELRRILLPLDWEGYPLRKDYKAPESYHGIKNERVSE